MNWDISEAFPIAGLKKFSPMRSRFIAEYVHRAIWEIRRDNGQYVVAWIDHSDDPIYQIMAEQNFHTNPVERAKRLLMRIFTRKSPVQRLQVIY